MTLTVATFRWGDKYTNEHVNRLHNQLRRELRIPFEFAAFVDHAQGLDTHIPYMKVWPQISKQTVAYRPNCYRRLRLFSHQSAEMLGTDYIMNLDLDIVITAEITELVRAPMQAGVTFQAYRDPAKNTPYNGGMWLLKAGAHPEVWNTFDPNQSPHITAREGRVGSDQAWIGHALGPRHPTWGKEHGIYSFGREILKNNKGVLPADCRMVMMFGPHDPAKKNLPWIMEHWR